MSSTLKYTDAIAENGEKSLFVGENTRREASIKRAKPVDVGEKYSEIVDPAQGVFLKAVIANTQIDRHRDYFTLEALTHFVPQIKAGNVALQLFHDDELIVGRLVDAEVKQSADGAGYDLEAVLWVMTSTALPDQPNTTVANAATSGLLKHVSVGFTGMMYKLVERGEGFPSIWEISPNPSHVDGGLLFEVSFVNIGAQIGAETKNATKKPERAVSFKNMKTQFHIDGKSLVVEGVADEKGQVDVKGLDSLVEGYTKAIDERNQATKRADVAENELTAIRAKYSADVVNYSKDTKAAITVEEVAKMSLADVISKAIELTSAPAKAEAEPAHSNTKYGYE